MDTATSISEPFFRGQKPFAINGIKKNLGNEPNFLSHETAALFLTVPNTNAIGPDQIHIHDVK